MARYSFNQAFSALRTTQRRRPAGVSRREKHRSLKFEALEDRRVMSANPVTTPADELASMVRDVLFDSQTEAAFAQASDLSQYTQDQLANTDQWVVLAAKGVDAGELTAGTGVAVAGETGVIPWSYIVDSNNGNSTVLVDSLSGSGLVDYFYPLVPFEIEALAAPLNDEFLENQWSLINFGQNTGNPDFSPFFGTVDEDINIEGAWEIVTGNGVVIGIVDSGVFTEHPDLNDNIRNDLAINLITGGSNPNPSGNDAHGTAVAGIAAAEGNNGIGIAGVAYNAEIAPIRLFSDDPFFPSVLTDAQIGQAFLHQSQVIGVYNHSWGTPPPADDQGVILNPRTIIELGPLGTTSLRNSVFFGRGNLGGIHVFAAGNSAGIDDTGNYSELVNSRYTIGVTSVIEDGTATSYAESSAAALVAAPSGSNPLELIRDEELGSGIYTTDLLGEIGFNQSPFNGIEIDADYLTNLDYSSRFNGTSASAPIVSGVIALMLEANPNLTYRDVQHILVRSARQNFPGSQTWITNNQQLFNDPLAFDSDPTDTIFDGAWPFARGPSDGDPGADPPVPATPHTQVYYQQASHPELFTNGAGFTVSHLSAGDEIGYAHGVVDASLAVELARNWVTVGGQTSERHSTGGAGINLQINASAISNEETSEFRIPGGVIGPGDPNDPNAFIDFFNEFGEEDDPATPDPLADPPEDPDGPFSGDDPPINTRDDFLFLGAAGIPLSPSAMTVEWVEVELDLTAPDANDYDFLRIVLISPDGTQSELKNYHIPNNDGGIFHNVVSEVGDPDGNITNRDDGGLNAVFTTNRHWGERTEGKVRLNTDGTTVNDFDGSRTVDSNPNPDGTPIVDGWRLVFENYSDSVINIDSYEVVFHGSDVTGTGRIQGAVGVDDVDIDGVFSDADGLADNFTRYVETNFLDGLAALNPIDPDEGALFASIASLDPYIDRDLNPAQESWAAGVIVYVDLNLNGQRDLSDPMYQVGNDGNYFFDLPSGDYNIRIDANSLEAAGLHNQANLDLANGFAFAEVTITNSGERISGFSVVDPVDAGTTFFTRDGLGDPVSALQTSVPDLNLLLTANAKPDNIINLSGFVYADFDTNGIKDGDDGAIAGASVFIDINQNGVYTPGFDLLTTTDGSGHYEFVDQPVAPGFYSVAVLTGTTGAFDSPVTPDDAEQAFFLEPEFANDAVNFGFEIDPTGGGPGGGAGAISGVVFTDVNNNGLRDPLEVGVAGIATVYLDLNNNDVFDGTDQAAQLGSNGSFVFGALTAGLYVVRIEFDGVQYEQTTPAGPLNPDGSRIDEDNFEYRVTVSASQAATGNDFGLHNLAVDDYGDLPSAIYDTTLAQNGARHTVFGDLFLGAGVDADLDGPVDSDGSGDDMTGFDDEDGITFSTLFNGATPSTSITITVDANTDGGYLQGWMDFNEDGIFQASERVFDDELLPAGVSVFTRTVPGNLTAGGGTVYARFRYGEQGITSPFGPAVKGEVEDYALAVVSNAIDPGAVPEHGPDFNEDGYVSGADFLAWQRGFGATSGAEASDGDSNSDGAVNNIDLADWEALYGDGPQSAPTTGDFDSDGHTDGADFLAWQRGAGSASPAVSLSDGDGNDDNTVDSDDLDIWAAAYGTTSTASAAASSGGSGNAPSAPATVFQATTAEPTSTANVHQGAALGPRAPLSVATVADTPESTSAARVERQSDRRDLDTASLAQAIKSKISAASERLHRSSGTPLGSFVSDTAFDQSVDIEDLGFVLRDRIHDLLFSNRHGSLEDRFELFTERENKIEDAFSAALGEEIDWRFG